MAFDAVAMEDYVAQDERPLNRCLFDVEACDLYVGVFAWRYGYIPEQDNPHQLSISELEFRHARALAKPCLIFLLSEDAPWPRIHMDTGPEYERIKRFREQLQHELLVGFFSSADDLAAQVAAAVQNWSAQALRAKIDRPAREGAEEEGEPRTKVPTPRIFLSYSHTDARWLSRLQIHLRVIERLGLVDLWSDTRIQAEEKWRPELQDVVNSSNAAVLLLSADFLASEFIMTNELPPLLAAGEERGALILPVMISACRFESIKELAQFQCVNDPRKPLNLLTKGRQEQVFDRVAELILSAFQ